MHAAAIRAQSRRHSLCHPFFSEVTQRAGVDVYRLDCQSILQRDDRSRRVNLSKVVNVLKNCFCEPIHQLFRGIRCRDKEVVQRCCRYCSRLSGIAAAGDSDREEHLGFALDELPFDWDEADWSTLAGLDYGSHAQAGGAQRSAERRVGKEGVSTGKSRWAP